MHSPFIPGIYNMGAGALGLVGLVVWGFFSLLALAVIIGLVFLLVRFLLVATRAAQLYVQKNEPPKSVAPKSPATPPAPSAPTPTAPTTRTVATAPTTSTVQATTAKPPAATAKLPAADAVTEKLPATPPSETASVPKDAAARPATTRSATKPRTPKAQPAQ